MINIKKPKIKDELNGKNINSISLEEIVDDSIFENQELDCKLNNIEFNGCIFKNIKFKVNNISNVEFTNCIFDTCDLSNVIIDEKYFIRCEFTNSLLLGTSIINYNLNEISFNECNLQYANISSKLNNVLFKNCNMKSVRLFENIFKNVIFDDCNLAQSEIYKTSLRDVDLSNCNIDDLNIDLESIKGAILDLNGIITISKILDVKLKM